MVRSLKKDGFISIGNMKLEKIYTKGSMKISLRIFVLGVFLVSLKATESYGQQDPQYTQYMYNTMSINPGYAGSKDHLSIATLGRTQWVGIDGAPETQTVSFHTPVGYSGVGFGMSIINDKLGPSQETYVNANISYTIQTSEEGNLAFGLRLGGRLLNLDWSKGRFQDPTDVIFNQDINNKFLPTLGAGLYYHTEKWYMGLSVPNFLRTKHYDDNIQSAAVERMHYFLIGGYVFDLNDYLKFKPAFIAKVVPGAPLSVDVSANFLIDERFNAGLAYRWGDSISALIGFQVSETMHIGYAYDLTTSNYKNYNSGTHEVMLIFDILREPRLKSPRFF